MNYNFDWDRNKSLINKRKHGLDFEEVVSVFKDPYALTIFDVEHSQGEERWITLGMTIKSIIVVVCHTVICESPDYIQIRIYSARKATKREKARYEER